MGISSRLASLRSTRNRQSPWMPEVVNEVPERVASAINAQQVRRRQALRSARLKAKRSIARASSVRRT